jgi:16S rRNA (uracil1498-N3)-methyltransferase
VDVTLEEENVLVLPQDEAHHIQKVLRAKRGDVFEVVDATLSLFVAELQDGREAAILEKLQGSGKGRAEVTLYQAVPKGKHMDLVVEKAVEIGVSVIVPLVTEHSVVRPEGEGKVERWRRLAHSAARQSLQLRVPQVTEPTTFEEALREADGEGVLLHNEPDLPPLEEVVSSTTVRLFVGPEGGWSASEILQARESGFSVAQLGQYRLRSETAGIVAVARAIAALERSEEK